MANVSTSGIEDKVEGTSTTVEERGETGGVGSPISNEAYNVISALHAKLEGLEAYRKYSKDCGESLWRELTKQEVQGVQMLVSELERLVKDGKFRMIEPGSAH